MYKLVHALVSIYHNPKRSLKDIRLIFLCPARYAHMQSWHCFHHRPAVLVARLAADSLLAVGQRAICAGESIPVRASPLYRCCCAGIKRTRAIS